MARETHTQDRDYTKRLCSLQTPVWKRYLGVQLPYRWNLKRLKPGFTLEVGCGIGRNLEHLSDHIVGIDHNRWSIEICRSRGFRAYTPTEFLESHYAQGSQFDSLLLSHVLEHMSSHDAAALIFSHLRFLKPGGRIILMTPQEAGYRSDGTHETFLDFASSSALVEAAGCRVEQQFSFPLPRMFGRWFLYNEFVTVARYLETRPTNGAESA